MITIQGKGVSAGVSIGPLYFYRRASAEVEHRTVADTRAEWQRFLDAQAAAMEQLGVLAEKARSEAGDEAALLFEVHQMMAEDLDYVEAIEAAITQEKKNAEAAVSDTSIQFAGMFAAMDDPYMQARAADVKNVSARILAVLSGAEQGGIASDVPVLLAADDLAPSPATPLFWPGPWAFLPLWELRASYLRNTRGAPWRWTAAPGQWSSTRMRTPWGA